MATEVEKHAKGFIKTEKLRTKKFFLYAWRRKVKSALLSEGNGECSSISIQEFLFGEDVIAGKHWI